MFFQPRFSAEFNPLFPTRALELQALELCGAQDTFCLFDIAVTRRLSVGNSTKAIGRLLEQTAQLTQPSEYYCHIRNCRYTAVNHYVNFLMQTHMQFFVIPAVSMEFAVTITPVSASLGMRGRRVTQQVSQSNILVIDLLN